MELVGLKMTKLPCTKPEFGTVPQLAALIYRRGHSFCHRGGRRGAAVPREICRSLWECRAFTASNLDILPWKHDFVELFLSVLDEVQRWIFLVAKSFCSQAWSYSLGNAVR